MTEHDRIRLNDNPPVETQLYVMADAINALVRDSRELKNSVEEIRLLQREQNGNVALALTRLGNVERRADAHDDWHGEEDERSIARVHAEELEQARIAGKHEGVRTVLGIEMSIVKFCIGGGLVGVGLFVGKLVNLIGVW